MAASGVNARMFSFFGLIGLLIGNAYPSPAAADLWNRPTHLKGEAMVRRDIPADMVSFVVKIGMNGSSARALMDDLVARRAAIDKAVGSERIRDAEVIDIRIRPYVSLLSGSSAEALAFAGYNEVEEFRGSATMKYVLLTADDPTERLKDVVDGEISQVRYQSRRQQPFDDVVAELKAQALAAAIADARGQAEEMSLELDHPASVDFAVYTVTLAREGDPFHGVSVKATAHYPHNLSLPRMRPDPDAEPQKRPWPCFVDCGGRF